MMTAVRAPESAAVGPDQARFRYGLVFGLVLGLLMFEVLAPEAHWTRAVVVALAGAALTVAVATSRARRRVRRARARDVAGAALVVVIGVATGIVPIVVTWSVVTGLLVAVPVALGGGLLRLIKADGVTLQAVAGALAIYLVVGLLFASVIALAQKAGATPFFAPGHVTSGDRTYYSFTVLTTTGFGDYTAVTPLGHALAVLEMLTGQLYLVTVIGVLVGNFKGSARETK